MKTGDKKWEFKMNDVTYAGVLSTASDLVFSGGREGYFYALNARTGELLAYRAGRAVNSAPELHGRREAVRRHSRESSYSRSSSRVTSGTFPCTTDGVPTPASQRLNGTPIDRRINGSTEERFCLGGAK
jgi:hypothetical protein